MNGKLILTVIALIVSIATHAQQTYVDNGYEKGQLEGGYKVGIWEYFGLDKSTELKIDYDKGTLIYLKPDTSKYFVKLDSVWEYKIVNPYPRYIGSYVEFYKIVSMNIKYPLEAMRRKIEKRVLLEFEVNEQGQAVNVRTLNDDEKYFTEEIISAFNLVPNIWIPAAYNGESVPAKFILPFYFTLKGGKQSLPNLLNLEGRKLNEIIISIQKPK